MVWSMLVGVDVDVFFIIEFVVVVVVVKAVVVVDVVNAVAI